MKEFLLSIASGLVVAILTNLFIGRSDRTPGQTQSMTTTRSGRGFGTTLLAFLIGAALVAAVLFFVQGQGFHRMR